MVILRLGSIMTLLILEIVDLNTSNERIYGRLVRILAYMISHKNQTFIINVQVNTCIYKISIHVNHLSPRIFSSSPFKQTYEIG